MNETVKTKLAAWGLQPDAESLNRLELFAASLLEKNAVQNLVSKNDEPLLWERHILDSLAAAALLRRLLPAGALVADAGSGAGFPGLVLAAVLPEYQFELLDSRSKRCDFLTWAAAAMGCSNVKVFQRRLGEGGAAAGTKYSAVTERAMGQLENILPQCLNILDKGGFFLAWQSAAQVAQRRPAVEDAQSASRARLLETFAYRLPAEAEDRHIMIFRKS
ncbi:MAG: 16S rRNA (guanine(527)-N(7))-methyltransferase RsmG [Elusimicrobia bacterium GWA2_64_40]|nr:MAG: 16S rRNA (guanine(527)-N(7))-methyltransferase RsmG [Elusimicrobia bacterium GWA2_64_40]OGR66922.1 MAG: 16S rRNA (guanine(527)-N(7))-methyltransferase RsmG [Elusimicrobia bacterium GWB2_63_16]HAN04775.1 16S rRNA (guanine(527)-N(7))-methyltransferase RsmG [Elusimicrobiota bacterium]